jgi:hypothetical protein
MSALAITGEREVGANPRHRSQAGVEVEVPSGDAVQLNSSTPEATRHSYRSCSSSLRLMDVIPAMGFAILRTEMMWAQCGHKMSRHRPDEPPRPAGADTEPPL